MNLMSSSAKTLVGSVIAIVSVAPDRPMGTIWYFCAVSAGISLRTETSMSNCARLMKGTPYLTAEERGDLLVVDHSELDERHPQLAAIGLLMVQGLVQLRGSDALFPE